MSSICLVAQELDYVVRSGGIGTYNWLLAHLLAEAGWRVHVLYCGPVDDPAALSAAPGRLARAGIGFSHLEALPRPGHPPAGLYREPPHAVRSDWVLHALERLDREQRFDLIEFADWQALGFRPIQAKLAGLCFRQARMVVKLHGPSQWSRDAGLSWIEQTDELQLDFCERYAFEHADVQLSPARHMLAYGRGIGWDVRADARVVPNPFPNPVAPRRDGWDQPPEIVFFGRLQTLKGVEIFVEATRQLDPRIPLSFVGKEDVLVNGARASDYIRARLKGRRVSLLTDLDREQALAYLSASHRVAVIASLAENFPYTVIECAVNGIPFLAARVGGIPEIIPDPELQAELLFGPTPGDLSRCLETYLKADPARRRALGEQARMLVDVRSNHWRVLESYTQLPRPCRGSARAVASATARPLVTVCLTFYNLGAYLPDALASLAAQTYPNLEVLVIDDGSTDAASIRTFEQQRPRYPRYRFLRQANAGLGAARNRGLSEARGEYFIPFDADNVATPRMVERFVEGIRHRPALSALSAYFLAFRETSEIARGEFRYAYRPTGGPHVLGSIENVYGDATAIFRRADFSAVGGYETDRDAGVEDWEAFVKLVNAGYRVDVLPDYLYYYRRRDDSLTSTTDERRNRRRILRQYFRLERLPEAERIAFWTALAGLHARLARRQALRYRAADWLHGRLQASPIAYRLLKGLAHGGWHLWQRSSADRRRRGGGRTA